jgi:hypothetical protein
VAPDQRELTQNPEGNISVSYRIGILSDK